MSTTRRVRLGLWPRGSMYWRLLLGFLAITSIGVIAADALAVDAVVRHQNARVDAELEQGRQWLLPIVATGHRLDAGKTPPDGLVLVLDSQGRTLQRMAGVHLATTPLELSAEQLKAHAGGALTAGPVPLRAMVTRLPGGGYLVMAQSTADAAEATQHLVAVETATGLPLIFLVVAGSFWFCRRTLAPIRETTRTAHRITEDDLSHRVNVARAPLEAAQLAEAFNTMLQRLQQEFTRRNKAEVQLRDFVGVAGHELRTPLTTIAGYAQMVRHGALEDPLALDQAMRRVQGETRRMTSLVDELLLLARLDQGRPLERTPVDLTDLCAEAVANAQLYAPDRQLRCTVQPEDHMIEGDPHRLRQVICNLLANVHAHTPPGTSAHVKLTPDGDFRVIDVIDQGPGIPEDLHERVFDRFYRAPAANPALAERSVHGSGLGLSIVAAIVTAHHGTIRIQPTDHGTWFRVRLPRQQP
ncbi:sensor histidine kinase [Streptacidiphilus sp. EB103A]|uniref:sensor histidine kinase n=1 Tax=Streptacidiphilus sp. EB103A TaxID=3156275 RepID=UPI003518AB53